MSTTSPILYVIGIEGQICMAKALSKEIKRPVIAIATCQRMMEVLEQEEHQGIFQHIYSLPNTYLEQIDQIKKYTPQELNEEQINLEQELKTQNSALYTSYDRTLRYDGDHNKIRYWQICALRLTKKIFDETNPAFIVSGVATYIQHVIHDVCLHKNIPYIRASSNRTGGMVIYHADGRFVGMEKYFKDLQTKGKDSIDKQACLEADKEFDTFVQKPTVPEYTTLGSTLGLNVPLLIKKVKYALALKRIFPSDKIKKIDRDMNIEYGPVRIMLNALTTGLRRSQLKLLNLFNPTPDLSIPYIYVPLHYAPEISDMYFGSEQDHHEAFITHLAKQTPSDCKLYVKDHVCMLGRRPTSFYQALSKIYNVELVDPAISTFELSQNAKATLTVTGTAGWEAYLLGKPVVVLGDVFYNFLPNVLYTKLDKDFFQKLKNYLDTFVSNEEESRNAYRAYYACSFKSPFVDIGETISRDKAQEMSEKYAKSFHDFINKFSDEITGEFPTDMLSQNTKDSSLRKAS